MSFKFNKQQLEAIKHKDGPALVLAVPGAGKTTVLIYRTHNLIKKHNINPLKILSITFSKASAKDMKNRFNNTFPNFYNIPVNFSTIHSFSYTILKEYAYRNNLKYSLIENFKHPQHKNKLLRKIYLDINGEYITEEKLETVINTIGYIKNMMFTIDDFLQKYKVDIKNFKKIYTKYENYKYNNFLIDFDDMLTYTLNILNKDKYLLNKYRNKFDYIQVDEGQDTSKIQMEIIKTISQPKNNLFIVADDDQSIYRFRGASPENILNFKEIYPQANIFYMEQNFRSSNNIVNVCNKFIKQNTLRYNKELFTENKNIRPVKIIRSETIIDEYEYLIEMFKKHGDLSNSAILYRNNISSLGLIEYLDRNNIPFYIRDAKISFANHWVVKDILAFLNVAYDNKNIFEFEKIYYKTKGYIYKKHINWAKTLSYNIPIFDRLLQYPDLKKDYKKQIKELKVDFKRLSNLKPYDAISFIEKDLKYEKYLKENSIKFGYTYDSLKTILFNLKLIAKNTNNIKEFLGRLKYLDYITYRSRKEKNGVRLSTIHSAKGLEFKKVYIIDLIEGDFPTFNSIEAFEKGQINLLEEERRLFYVGMTRAKEVLDLITIDYKNESKVKDSRFLIELEDIFKDELYKKSKN
ncbi:ATP-dependent helicase [Anaerosalibacter bizertensis]|uniref:DNA 3'-5' helicase n=1 Tax=Anaerosalibacter bizertensis TaxID=932217 RepID=A0A844FE12_9FIRM|nr:ATP-dependent helicase [Anaerosalibacter bizertensis]MSS42227.1 ATP-dependent helicase [Anaerosalibacter bizertensis]